uniref:Uncharacterized protein n=1 Tax=Kalanchoe fedtschenkoi TaxID=63787 RepID=A0A7N0UDX5_KALFE
MSRQRGRADADATEAAKKRKTDAAGEVSVKVKVEEEEEMGLLPWWPSEMIDEQMSWSMVWLPSWDAEFVGRAYHLLYGDVAWDDDIWGLKAIHEIPTS